MAVKATATKAVAVKAVKVSKAPVVQAPIVKAPVQAPKLSKAEREARAAVGLADVTNALDGARVNEKAFKYPRFTIATAQRTATVTRGHKLVIGKGKWARLGPYSIQYGACCGVCGACVAVTPAKDWKKDSGVPDGIAYGSALSLHCAYVQAQAASAKKARARKSAPTTLPPVTKPSRAKCEDCGKRNDNAPQRVCNACMLKLGAKLHERQATLAKAAKSVAVEPKATPRVASTTDKRAAQARVLGAAKVKIERKQKVVA